MVVLLLKNSYNSLPVLKTASKSWMFHLFVDLIQHRLRAPDCWGQLDGSFLVHFSFCLGVQVFIAHFKKMIICCLFLLFTLIFFPSTEITFVTGAVTMVLCSDSCSMFILLFPWCSEYLFQHYAQSYICLEQMSSTNNFDLCGPGTTFKHTFFRM